MTATATIATETTSNGLLVPNGALRFNPEAAGATPQGSGLNVQVGLAQQEQKATIGVGSKQQVYVLKADGTLEKYAVVVGPSDGRLTLVTSTKLKPGMKVVTGIKAKAK
jgi:HlyD family secretion protein